MAEDKPKVLRDTDDDARALARELIATARFAAIAVTDPETGYPNASRVLIGTDAAGGPILLASRLSGHTKALLASTRCSLLVGEPGKGDPMAWPRLSLQCDAIPVATDDAERPHIRSRFLRSHPKASLYADFPDFLFFRLKPALASLNGGFGRAYALTPEDLAVPATFLPLNAEDEASIINGIENWLSKDAEAGNAFSGWRLSSLDADGLTLQKNEQVKRMTFADALTTETGLIEALNTLKNKLAVT